MEKRLIKVNPMVLDMEDLEPETQESLFAIDDDSYLKLDRNEATVSPSPGVLKEVSRALDKLALNRRPDLKSHRLRRKLSLYTGVDFKNIACFGSVADACGALTGTYLYPGLEILMVGRADLLIEQAAMAAGATINYTEHNDYFELKIEEVINSITPKTRLIYLSNPNSLSGAILTEAEIVFLLAYAENSLVIVDETFFEFCGLTVTDLIEEYPNLAILRSFSGAFALAGIDTACLLTDYDNLRFINRIGLGQAPNSLAQVAAEKAIDELNYTAGYVRLVNESKKMLYESLLRLGYNFKITAANFLLLQVNDPQKLTAELKLSNIYINNLDRYQEFKNHVKITIGTPSQTGVLLDALARLAESHATVHIRAEEIRTSKNRLEFEQELQNS